MNIESRLDQIRNESLDSISRNESFYKALLVVCGIAEVVGLFAVFWFMDWSDQTHLLLFSATMLVWINLAFFMWALATRNRVGEQRILQAIGILHDSIEHDRPGNDQQRESRS